MAEQQVCTFFLNSVYFGIDVQHVQEVIRPQVMTRVPLAPPDICGLINLRGQILTVIDLQRRLEMNGSERSAPQSSSFNLIIHTGHEVASLLVDEVGDVLAFAEDEFEPPPATLKGKMRQLLAGAYALPTGFLLILDPEKILGSRS